MTMKNAQQRCISFDMGNWLRWWSFINGEDLLVSSYMSSITHWPSSSISTPSTFRPCFDRPSARTTSSSCLQVLLGVPALVLWLYDLSCPFCLLDSHYTTDACFLLQFLLSFFQTQSWGGRCWIYYISTIRRRVTWRGRRRKAWVWEIAFCQIILTRG